MSDELLADFHAQKTFQLGEFILKSGVSSPIYVDLRVLISSPKILAETGKALCEIIKNAELDFDYVVGVPYGAIMLATLVSYFTNKPMLLKRKEAKGHGNKLMIEGRYEPGKKALVVEDVVTSGGSVLETVEELRKVDLICDNVLCVLDREQGGVDKLRSEDIVLHSVITMSKILDFLVKQSEITEERKLEIQKFLKDTSVGAVSASKNNGSTVDLEVKKAAPPRCGLVCEPNGDSTASRTEWSLSKRQSQLARNALNKRVCEFMLKKKTNLCLAADCETAEEILSLVNKTKEYICALKLHHDTIKNFDAKFLAELHRLANDHEFVVFEDRKFADTGKTMELQLEGGALPVAMWADMVTVHSVAGCASVKALKSVIGKEGYRLSGCLLIAELSTENALTKLEGYVEETVRIAEENSRLVAGFICQKRCHEDPSFLYWSPGVNLSSTDDGQGQQWRTVERAVLVDGCDIIIVGRGISSAADVTVEARRYAHAGWEALSQRELEGQ